jgi:hypothetical protein
MRSDDLTYYEQRAQAELELAQHANNAKAVQAHYDLATAYLEKIHGEEPPAES